ncbi:MAG TPA: alpha/beta hydrolase [Mycobacterium sp.]|nr:alpha/beta hydrolase [Mycobacterium sp.]
MSRALTPAHAPSPASSTPDKKIDPRIKAVATVSMYDMGGVNRNGLRGAMTPEMRQEALALAAQQRDVEFTGGDVEYVGGTPFELDDQSTAIDRESYDFYRTARGNSPDTTTQPTLSSNARFMNFYPFKYIETISPRPMLFITGEGATPASSANRPTSAPPNPSNWSPSPAPATSTSTTEPTSSPSTRWPPSSRPTWKTPSNDR